MSEHVFKVGDVVRCVEPIHPCSRGEIYEVKHHVGGSAIVGDGRWFVDIDVYSYCFEPIEHPDGCIAQPEAPKYCCFSCAKQGGTQCPDTNGCTTGKLKAYHLRCVDILDGKACPSARRKYVNCWQPKSGKEHSAIKAMRERLTGLPVVSIEEQAARQKREAEMITPPALCWCGQEIPTIDGRTPVSCADCRAHQVTGNCDANMLRRLPGPVIDSARGERTGCRDRREVDRIRTYNHPRGFREDRGV